MTQFTLKFIALVCMLLDHTAKVLLPTGVLIPLVGVSGDLFLRTSFVAVGRIAFPVFAWFVAEGCKKSRRPGRYLLRLGIAALCSELPFQLCFYGRTEIGFHNVLFTFLLAAGSIFLARWMEGRGIAPVFSCIPLLAATVLGWVLYTDYNAWGVVLVLLFYYMPEEKGQLLGLLAWITMFQLVWHGWNGRELIWLSRENFGLLIQYIVELLAIPLLACYNGQRGRGVKWMFYLFYPVHLFLLYYLRGWL